MYVFLIAIVSHELIIGKSQEFPFIVINLPLANKKYYC